MQGAGGHFPACALLPQAAGETTARLGSSLERSAMRIGGEEVSSVSTTTNVDDRAEVGNPVGASRQGDNEPTAPAAAVTTSATAPLVRDIDAK